MVYAIVRAGGRQEKVEVGTVLTVDRQKASEDGSVTFAPVLLVDGETVTHAAADLANVVNEAALLTARTGGTSITNDSLEEAIDRVIAGPERRTRAMSDREKKMTAYHEGGHALVAAALPGTDPVEMAVRQSPASRNNPGERCSCGGTTTRVTVASVATTRPTQDSVQPASRTVGSTRRSPNHSRGR